MLFQAAESCIDPGTVVPVLLARLGATNVLIGFASAMSDMGWLLPQVLVVPWASRLRRQLALYRQAAVVRAIGLLLVAVFGLVFASQPHALVGGFLIGYGLYSFAAGAGAVAFMEVVGRTVAPDRLTPLWSRRFLWGGLLGAALAFGIRPILELPSAGLAIAILFGAAVIFAACGWAAFSQVREPDHPPTPSPHPGTLLRRGFELLRADTDFRRLLAARSVLHVWFAASPFVVLFAVRDLDGGGRAAGTFLIARIAGFVLGNLVWPPLARAHGNRALMIAGTVLAGFLGFAAAAIAFASPAGRGWIGAPGALLLLEALAFLGGAVHSGLSVGYASLSLELAPPGERQAFFSLLNTFLGPTLLLPAIAGALLDVTSPPLLFAVCGALALWGSRAAAKLPGPAALALAGARP